MSKRAAFSLVELSIVLVILGLLTGGILGGQSLINAAALRSVSTDISKYTTATYAFRDKYFALPGDMSNASQFWGLVSATATTCASTQGSGTATCNGDGNGQIAQYGPVYGQERYRFWQHLVNAGLIEGTYTGVRGTPPGTSDQLDVPGTNLPKTKYRTASIAVVHVSTGMLGGGAANWMNIASGVDPGTGILAGRAFPQDDAWNIDTKLDDGMPDTGRMRAASGGYATGCVTSATPPAYALANSSNSSLWCPLWWNTGV